MKGLDLYIIAKRILLTLLVVISMVDLLPAQGVKDAISVYFRQGKLDIDTLFINNKIELKRMVERIKHTPQGRLKKVRIISSASPEGTLSLNQTLSAKRADAIVSYLQKESHFHIDKVEVKSLGVDWNGLQEWVNATPDMPYRDDVLHVFAISEDDKQLLPQLQALHGGIPYQYMYRQFFPSLRRSQVFFDLEAVPKFEQPRISFAQSASKPMALTGVYQPMIQSEKYEEEDIQRWALKTNLLYDALLSPSIEVEYRMNDRWSLNTDYAIAWWSNKSKHKYYQLMQLSPEMRYWFNPNQYWRGHYIGAFLGAGYYDLENGARGYKGEYAMAGFSYGYMFPIGKQLSMEAGIGFGYLYTEYEEYLPLHGHYVYQQTSRTNYIGPVKAKLTLVWRIPSRILPRWMKGGSR